MNWREQGPTKLHRILMREDPAAAMAAASRPTASGSCARWKCCRPRAARSSNGSSERGKPLIDRDSARLLVIEPDRAELVARIDARFDAMIEHGAMEEVEGAWRARLDPALPAMKAIGVRELLAAAPAR